MIQVNYKLFLFGLWSQNLTDTASQSIWTSWRSQEVAPIGRSESTECQLFDRALENRTRHPKCLRVQHALHGVGVSSKQGRVGCCSALRQDSVLVFLLPKTVTCAENFAFWCLWCVSQKRATIRLCTQEPQNHGRNRFTIQDKLLLPFQYTDTLGIPKKLWTTNTQLTTFPISSGQKCHFQWHLNTCLEASHHPKCPLVTAKRLPSECKISVQGGCASLGYSFKDWERASWFFRGELLMFCVHHARARTRKAAN